MDIVAYTNLMLYRHESEFAGIPWKDFNFNDDPYYPGAKGAYTDIQAGICIFKNPEKGCRIHQYCVSKNMDIHKLKFFACCMFPLSWGIM